MGLGGGLYFYLSDCIPAIEIAANTTQSPALAPFGRCRWDRRGLGDQPSALHWRL